MFAKFVSAKPDNQLKVNVSLCCTVSLVWVEFSLFLVTALILCSVEFRHNNLSDRVRKTSRLGLKHLF